MTTVKTLSEPSVEKKALANSIVKRLEEIYPEAPCALEYNGEGWKLLVMARLSAQCKDVNVNKVCRVLFETYPTPEELGNANVQEVEEIIYSLGLHSRKANDIVKACRRLVNDYDGIVPNSMDELLKFEGVGRKVANLLIGDLYNGAAVVVDTHCIRISRRMGLVEPDIKAPEKIEKILARLIDDEKQSDFCHRIVMLGRQYCPAGKHICSICPLSDICQKIDI